MAVSEELSCFLKDQCDASGFGEGERVLGSVSGTTDGNGDFAFTRPVAGSVADGEQITATVR